MKKKNSSNKNSIQQTVPQPKKPEFIMPPDPPYVPNAKNRFMQNLFDSLEIKKIIKDVGNSQAKNIETNIKENLRKTGTIIFEIRSTMEESPLKNKKYAETALNRHERFEQKLREARYKETMKEKAELEKKLKEISETINVMEVKTQFSPEISKPKIREYSLMSEKDRKKWKEEWGQKEKEAKEFTKKMKEIQRNIMNHKKSMMSIRSEKLLQEKSSEAENKAYSDHESETEEEKLEKQKLKEERKKYNEMLKNFASAAPPRQERLYKKMEKHFIQDIEMPELEKRKLIIAEKRNLYKPIRKAEIEESLKSHDDFLKKMDEERQERIRRLKEEQLKYMEKVQKEYKTIFTDEIIKNKTEQEKLKHEFEEIIKERASKRISYAKIVKEEHPPKVSLSKAEELKKLIEKLKQPVRKPNIKIKTPKERSQNIGKRSLDSSHEKSEKCECKYIVKSKECPIKNKILIKSIDNESIIHAKNKTPEMINKVEYWNKEIRPIIPHKKEEKTECNYEKIIQDQNLSQQEKINKIKQQSDAMTENARKKENKLQVKVDINECEDIAGIYLSAIRAKISLLNI